MTTPNPSPDKLSDDARRILDRYLREVRRSLHGCRTVDPAEVEADVRQHIDQELADEPAPVSADRLRAVLAKLGSPAQWVPLDEQPWWRRTMLELKISPASDRWAIAVFAVWVLGVLLLPVVLGLVLLAASFFLARAMVARSEEAGEQLGWRRWLVYPPLVTVYLPVLMIAACWRACTSGVAFILTEGEKIVGRSFEVRPRTAKPSAPTPTPVGGSC